MTKLDQIIAKYNRDYTDLLLKFASKKDLPMDVDLWPEADQLEWFDLSDKLTAELDKAKDEYYKTPLDQRESDDWYLIDVTLDTLDGPEYETIDVRKVSMEKLQNICQMFPKYNGYYFNKITDSL